MRPENYAQAIVTLLEKGEKPKEVVKKMRETLEKQGRLLLLPHIGRSFVRLAERSARKNRNTLVVAREKDEKAARRESGAKGSDLLVDESLIGGWRLEKGDTLTDKSWKTHLLTLFTNATRA